MVFSRYLRLSVTLVLSLIFGINSNAMQAQGLDNQFLSYVPAPEQSLVTIEQYQHSRDYHDLYRLFNENYNNLGAWGYDDTFPHGSQIKVARWQDQLAGFVIYTQHENLGYINYVAVDEQIRSNGLGKILLNDAINDLKYQGAEAVSLSVYAHNRKAQSLYERLGFYLQSANDSLMNYTLNLA